MFPLLTKMFEVFCLAGDFLEIQTSYSACSHVVFCCAVASLSADSRFAPSQWETSLQSNAVSHWLSANLESAIGLQSCSHHFTRMEGTLNFNQHGSTQYSLLQLYCYLTSNCCIFQTVHVVFETIYHMFSTITRYHLHCITFETLFVHEAVIWLYINSVNMVIQWYIYEL